MREIKFRGQRTDTKEWVYGSLSQVNPNSLKGSYFICERQTRWKGSVSIMIGSFFEVIPETVGQFTGLKDKNDVDIYEDDIVEFELYDYVLNKTITKKEIVKFYEISWSLCLVEQVKVIGNKHNNPELLKGDK